MSVQDNFEDQNDFRQLRVEMTEMKSFMGQMAHALTRLALLEERQQGVSQITSKILEQVEEVRKGQHQTDLKFAHYGDLLGRTQRLEDDARTTHLAAQTEKAALLASLRTIKLIVISSWAVFALGMAIGIPFLMK